MSDRSLGLDHQQQRWDQLLLPLRLRITSVQCYTITIVVMVIASMVALK